MADKDIRCAIGVDLDAVAGWLGSYGGEDSPDDISRGLFAGEVGTPRLLKLFRKFNLTTTWFIPGHSIETFRDEVQEIVDDGHEIGLHGYSHENPIAMTREQEESVLNRCIDLITQVTGTRPTGYVAPWWEFSPVTAELLLSNGVKYDHSLMHKDFECYYVRVGDRWTKIDFEQPADCLDAGPPARPRDRLGGDTRQLVPRRPAPHDVHQEVAQQPRLRQPKGHRADVARPVRLRLPRVRRRRVPHHHPPRCEWTPPSAADARAQSSPTSHPTPVHASAPSTR